MKFLSRGVICILAHEISEASLPQRRVRWMPWVSVCEFEDRGARSLLDEKAEWRRSPSLLKEETEEQVHPRLLSPKRARSRRYGDGPVLGFLKIKAAEEQRSVEAAERFLRSEVDSKRLEQVRNDFLLPA